MPRRWSGRSRCAACSRRWCDVDHIRIERTAVYRFHAREAKSFSKGRCFLAGDAAHITPPFAGQGLVAGLRDVANLAWKLAWVVRGQADAGILDSYDAERRPHAKKIINLARLLGALVMPSNRAVAFALHGLIRAIRVLPAGRALFDDLKIKPENTFDAGLFWRNRRNERLRAGSTLPQGWVRPAGGSPVLSDDALGLHWALVGVGVDPTTRLRPDQLHSWQRAGGKVWQWCQRAQAQHLAAADRRLEALDETLLPRRVPLGWVFIVRPDRCVMAEGPVEQVARAARSGAAPSGARRRTPAAAKRQPGLLGVPSMRRELICLEPSSPPRLQVRESAMPEPRRGQVLVRVEATSVNPIDAKRPAAMASACSALKGAGRFPLVLGNDWQAASRRPARASRRLRLGQRVFGLVATGKGGGAHASHVVVPESLLQAAPEYVEAPALAVLPYSFTTMWLAVRSTHLTAANAAGKRVLVHGAAGALGRLALQVLSGWGCHITAICDAGKTDDCRALGARVAVERGPQAIPLPAHRLRRRAELCQLGR